METNTLARFGNFSSSEIYKLMTNGRNGGIGAPGLTYIEEKRFERLLGRPLSNDVKSRPAQWGDFVQHRVTNLLLGTDCTPTKSIRRKHQTIPNWTGAEDYIRNASPERSSVVGEIKCFELKKFCQVHDTARLGFEILRSEFPEIYWQLVSNSILCGLSLVELTLYVPYRSELDAIRESVELEEGPSYIQYATDDELPYLIEGGHYRNLTTYQFEVFNSVKDELTNRVSMAVKMLNK